MATIKQFIVTDNVLEKELTISLSTKSTIFIGIKTKDEPETEQYIIPNKEEVQFIINALNDLIKEM